MNVNKKEIIKCCIAISIILIIVAIVIAIILKYQVNGEENMPFKLSKITIISTAEGQQNDDNADNSKWNFNINQSNDVFFFIDKNESYKDTKIIDSISIENITITKAPQKGNIKVYMPNSEEGRRFVYKDNYLVHDKLEYNGAKASNEKTLEIGNQGGNASIRFANTNVVSYKSDEDSEIVHDGTLFKRTNTSNDELKFSVNFDFIIKIGKVNYKANISLDLPYGNIVDNGTTNLEKTDLDDIIFKRI